MTALIRQKNEKYKHKISPRNYGRQNNARKLYIFLCFIENYRIIQIIKKSKTTKFTYSFFIVMLFVNM